MRKPHKNLLFVIVAVLALLPFSALRGEDKPAPANPPAASKPAEAMVPAKERDELATQVKNLTAQQAEFVRSVQIVQQQRNQVANQLLDTQAQLQIVNDQVAALTKQLADANAKLTAAEKPADKKAVSTDTAPFVAQSVTSREAAAAIMPRTAKLRAKVYDAIVRAGEHGRTDAELQAELGMDGSTERPRRIELVNTGLVVDSGNERRGASGRASVVWIAKP